MGILDKILGGNVLYYPGCLTKFGARDLKQRYEKILEKIGIDFIELSERERCCGSPAIKAGFVQDFKRLARDNLKMFKEHSVKKIITNCPACFMVLKKEYKKVLNGKWNIEVEHISQTIFKAVKDGKIKPKEKSDKATFHDPCHLGRQMGVYQEPREVIKALGYEILEMELNKKESFCCGAGGGVRTNEPQLAEKIAKKRLKEAEETGVKTLITACPLCYLHLKENAQNLKVLDLSQLFD